MKEDHECELVEDNVYIYKKDGEWRLNLYEELDVGIDYCPFCGKKLE